MRLELSPMKRWLRLLVFVGLLCTGISPQVGIAARLVSVPTRVAILPGSGPHVVHYKTLVTFHVRVSGLTLDPKHIGKAPVAGHGHVQIYLDKIPADAMRRMDMKGIVAVVGVASFSIGFTRPWIRLHAGKHRLLIALARNDDVLYHAAAAPFAITVR